MIPENALSQQPVVSGLLTPDADVIDALTDVEDAGVAVQDTSEGALGYRWTCYMRDIGVFIRRQGAAEVHAFDQPGVLELTFAFDQNMRPNFAYRLLDGTIVLRWFDSLISNYAVSVMGSGRNPRLTMDDKRPENVANSDIILAYIRADGALCYRQQRDRYTIERVLQAGIRDDKTLRNVGMNSKLRLQFDLP